nr:magnetosome protein Mad15 [Desulfobacteraceae bacterium]
MKGGGNMTISLGGIFLLALVCAVVAIGVKVNGNTQKIQELDNLLSK